MQARKKPVVLLIAESVTLAHFARIVALAQCLDTTRYDVVVAADPRFARLGGPLGCAFLPLSSISSAEFAQALARGKALYSVKTLTRYVEDDLALLNRVKPDLIVGDFRLSLAVSAPLSHVPYAAVVNVYWSPYADVAYPVPDLPMARIFGVTFSQRLFDIARPVAFALHAHPLNRVRRRYGLAPLGRELTVAYSWGDYTLYADVPELVATRPLPANHRFIGPPLWSTSAPVPAWWDRVPQDKPVVLLTLGSSGRGDSLPTCLSALAGLDVTAIVATAGKVDLPEVPSNVYVADFLPLDRAVQRAALVICNGGSLSTYQALACGVPILGICTNMDQLMNMQAIERHGAGISMRAARVRPKQVRNAILTLLGRSNYARAAARLGAQIRQTDTGERFREFVRDVVG